MNLELIEQQVSDEGLQVVSYPLPERIRGLICCLPDNETIALNTDVRSNAEKYIVLAEELMHYRYSYGNILKSPFWERKARKRTYELLVPREEVIRLIPDYLYPADLAEHFGVTTEFLIEALRSYNLWQA